MSQKNAPLRDHASNELRIRESVAVWDRSQENPVPFKCWMDGTTLQLSLPTYARLEVKKAGFGWDLIHDGAKWARHGVRGVDSLIEFSIPLKESVRIRAQGRTFILRKAAMDLPRQSFDFKSNLKDFKFFSFSTAIHAAMFGVLIFVISWNPHIKGTDEAAAEKKAKKEIIVPAEQVAGGGAPSPIIPFEGMSYTKFMNMVTAKENEKNKVGNLLNNLTKMNLGKVQNTGVRGGLKTAAGGANISTNVGKGQGTAMTDSINAKTFAAAPAAGVHKLTDKDQQLLRDKLRECHDEFRRIYNRLLTQDPHLTVTVSFEAKVLPTGYLSVAGFKSRGTYLPGALAKLQSGMADVIKNVYVGKELSGTVIRSEDSFVR